MKYHLAKIKNHKNQKGIGLLETLTTMIIVSFGLVGIAMMQTQNTIYLNNSILKLKASLYAYDYVQRLSGNTTIARQASSPYILNDFTNTPPTIATSPICVTSSCTPDVLAVYDVNVWLNDIKTDFPNGKAKITQEISANNAIYTIQIQWTYKAVVNTYQIVSQI